MLVYDIYQWIERRYLFRQWQQHQQDYLENDFKYCSQTLPQEQAFLKKRLEKVTKMKPLDHPTFWRLVNWSCYIVLLLIFFILVGHVVFTKEIIGNNFQKLATIVMIFLWLRGTKHFYVISFVGPIILMLHEISYLLLKYLIMFCEMFIPFTAAFLFIFTGISQYTNSSPSLIFTVLQITIVHHYGYSEFQEIDPIMNYILVCLLIFGSIVCKSLVIGMLTKVFLSTQDKISNKITMERMAVLVQRDNSWFFYYDHQAAHYFICKLCMPLIVRDVDYSVACYLKGAFAVITKQLHDIEIFLKTRIVNFKGIGGIRKRKEEELNLFTIEHDVNVLQKRLMRMTSLREKKNQLISLQLQIIFCLLERMRATTEPISSNQ
ncbi:uncharacterized protein LOC129697008 [Leucoraja erinacea]|uniref:uncharacterized protein LOC129697008 n=1 Tax=Leucoraja erinaceus TaxID=7782 RepID=UPI002457CE8D|nr:uncharacterized protein LOC129697008 [Leucoraja erinacea]